MIPKLFPQRRAQFSKHKKFRVYWKRRRAVEEDGEKEKKIREGVGRRETTEVEVADSDIAPVCGLSLSIAREKHEGTVPKQIWRRDGLPPRLLHQSWRGQQLTPP